MGNLFEYYWLDKNTLYLTSKETFCDEDGDKYHLDIEYWNDEKSYHFLQNYGDESLAFSAGDKEFLKHSKLIDKGITLIKRELKGSADYE